MTVLCLFMKTFRAVSTNRTNLVFSFFFFGSYWRGFGGVVRTKVVGVELVIE